MKNQNGYCEKCEKDQEFQIEEESKEYTFRGQTLTCFVLIPYCTVCGEEGSLIGLEDENQQRTYAAYSKANNLICKDMVVEIPKMYKISVLHLSLLLGWDNAILMRYINGFPPTKEHSNVMERLYNDSEYYKELEIAYSRM